jgi:hypothetical protein
MILGAPVEGIRKVTSRAHMQSNLMRCLDWGDTLHIPKTVVTYITHEFGTVAVQVADPEAVREHNVFRCRQHLGSVESLLVR